MQLITQPQATDLNRESGVRAYSGMSHVPEKRANGDIAEYLRIMASVAGELEAIADTPEKIAVAVAEFEAFRLKYLDWQRTLWAAKSRTMSPMITGPARFPVARNNKAMNVEHNKVGAFLDWFKRVQVVMARKISAVGQPPAPGSDKPAEVVEINGVQIVTNYAIERIQMLFAGKPDPDTIKMLKGAGWNWSPSNKAWQRKITDATMRSAKQIATA